MSERTETVALRKEVEESRRNERSAGLAAVLGAALVGVGWLGFYNGSFVLIGLIVLIAGISGAITSSSRTRKLTKELECLSTDTSARANRSYGSVQR